MQKDNKIVSKYRVNPEDRITVEIYISEEGNIFKVLPSYCLFTQGKAPCTGDITKPCNKRYSKCNHYTKDLCTDEIGKLEFLAKRENKEFPKTIRKEWAKFARESWAVRSYIEANAWKFDPNTQTRTFDTYRQQHLTLQCLLKDWSLGKYDDELVIQSTSVVGVPFTMIQEDQMKRISQIDGEIIKALLDGYYRMTRDLD